MKQGFILLSLFALVLTSKGESKQYREHNFPRLLDSFVTKNGNLTLSMDGVGYTAQVDFSYDYNDASDSNNDDYAKFPMAIALYSSEIFIAQSCLNFYTIDCASYGCSKYTYWTNSFTFPYYSVSGYYVYTHLYLDYGNYESEYYITAADSCSSNEKSSYGDYTYGVIGLGLNGTASNFLNSTLFTVSTNQRESTAQLLFREDLDRKAISTLAAVLETDANWQASAPSTTLYIDGSETTYNTTVIFDLDADGIGLPLRLYNTVVDLLEDSCSFSCDASSYAKPHCTYYGMATDLPIIKLTVQNYSIDIPPTIYAFPYPDTPNVYLNGFYLNFKALSPNLTGSSYVTPQYENYTILDRNFLNYYFAEFSGEYGYYISLYTQYSDNYHPINPLPPYHPVWPFIVGGCVGLVIIISIICCCFRAAKNRRVARGSSRVVDSQAPLIVNDQTFNLSGPEVNMPLEQNNQYMAYPYQQQQPHMMPNYGNFPSYTGAPAQNSYAYPPPPQGSGYTGNYQFTRSELNN